MAIVVEEKCESRFINRGRNPSAELRYHARGDSNEINIENAVLAVAPASYDLYGTGTYFLGRDELVLAPVGVDIWDVAVRYTQYPQSTIYQFETGGGSSHITQSLATAGRFSAGGQPLIDFKGGIGVQENAIEGVDIVVPVFNFSETHYLLDVVVDATYKFNLFSLTGTFNNAPFKGFNAGEVLFLGAVGSKRGSGDWEINFRFAAQPNVTGVTIGAITGIVKDGWNYLWVRYINSVDTVGKRLVMTPDQVNVEQVYKPGDFSLMGI
jgi:hypothetical protein